LSNPQQLIQKQWKYCSILRNDGLSYGDYVEQLTFLLFLKVADEQSRRVGNSLSPVRRRKLGKRSGMLGVTFRKAQPKLQEPGQVA
jgi:type I restriction enzyme M protein